MGSERGEQPLSCNDDDRCLRQKQGGVVGAVASRMQGPLKGRSIRWEPQPVQGRGVSRGREGGVETPLSPSGPAERPRRRCTLQKASDLSHATTLCAGSHRQMPLLSPAFPPSVSSFSAIFLRDFRLIFRWKAVVDSVQFRVILNITTKRFDVASWHAEMLRFGRRPTAADAASRNDPSREKATLENPQIFQSCKFKNNSSAAIARAKRRQFQIVHPTNERSLTYLESTTP